MLDFAHPLLLLLLWPLLLLPLLWLGTWVRSEKQLARFVHHGLYGHLRTVAPGRSGMLRASLVTLGLLLLVLAAAGPQSSPRRMTLDVAAPDVIFVLDVSRSMLSEDVPPNRLGYAKQVLGQVFERWEAGRIGLVVFRRSATLASPLTRDRFFVRHALAAAGSHSAAPGETDIGAGITLGTDLLDRPDVTGGFLVLLSDGEDLAGTAESATDAAANAGIRCITVGFGTREGGPIPAPDSTGNVLRTGKQPVITRRRDTVLRRIASTTDGVFIDTQRDTLVPPAQLCAAHLQNMARRTRYAKHQRERAPQHYQWLLLASLAAFLGAAWLAAGTPSPRRCTARALRATANTATRLVVLALLLCAAPICATPGTGTPSVTPEVARFNIAAHAFARRDYTQAIQILEDIAPSPDLPATTIRMALGCALYRRAESLGAQNENTLQEQAALLKRATEIFQAILRREPDNAAAATNCTVAAHAFARLAPRPQSPADVPARPESENGEVGPAPDPPRRPDPPPPDAPPQEDGSAIAEGRAARPPSALSRLEMEELMTAVLRREAEYRQRKQQQTPRTGTTPGVRDW